MQRSLKVVVMLVFCVVFCCSCAYTDEQLKQIHSVEDFAEKNAVDYIENKYGFKPEVDDISAEFPDYEGMFTSTNNPTGKAVVDMSYNGDKFSVYISGLGDDYSDFSYDNYQFNEIKESLIKKFDCYDIQLKYGFGNSCYLHDKFSGNNYKEIFSECSAEFVYINTSVSDFDCSFARDLGIKQGIAVNFLSRGTYSSVEDKAWVLNNNLEVGDKSIYINDYKAFYTYRDDIYVSCSKAEIDGIIYSDKNISAVKSKDFDLGSLKGIYTVTGDSYVINTDDDRLTVYIPSEELSSTADNYLIYSYSDEDDNYKYSACKLEMLDDGKYGVSSFNTAKRNNIKITVGEVVKEHQ